MTTFRNIPHLSRHQTALLLMGVSMVMLLVFQGLWLRKVYDERKDWLQKEADNLFQQAVQGLQDSMINVRILAPLDVAGQELDTAVILALKNVLRLDMTRSEKGATVVAKDLSPADTSKSTFSINEVRITISDSIRGEISQVDNKTAFLFTQKDGDSLQMKRFRNHWFNDSLSLTAVQEKFKQILRDSGFALSVQVLQAPFSPHSMPEVMRKAGDTRILTIPMPAGLPPRSVYYAAIGDYGGYLFRKTFPQGVFSLFLLLTTGLAFGFIYRSLRQQQRLAALKNDFISNVAHELKTPIATVGVAIESLRNFDALREPERTAEYLDISRHELNRLSMLVDKVLKMAIFEQKEPDLHVERFDFRQLVQEVLNSMKLQFEKYGATTAFTCEGDHFEIMGDRIHLTNVVYNLLDNALKYSEDTPNIQLELKADDASLVLRVRDEGIGIPPEYTGKVFEKFFRVPTGNRHNVKGYGLGLSYVAGVLLKHGGRIRLESTPGKGSSFIIHIPRKYAKD